MYRGATADNECPLVALHLPEAAVVLLFSGCWVCTMVSQDKSMEAMIQNDEEKEWMQPLLDIRNELDIKNDREKKKYFRRIYGRVELFERNMGDDTTSVEPIPMAGHQILARTLAETSLGSTNPHPQNRTPRNARHHLNYPRRT